MSEELAKLAHWLWAALVGLGAWFFRSILNRLALSENRVRAVELSQTRTTTENKALFKRLDELRDSIHDLANKMDRFMGR